MKANYHTHVDRCGHAGGKPADYVRVAMEKNLDILGFSDHAPFENMDYGARMQFNELELYCNDVQQVKEECKGKLQVLQSLEIEYLEEYDRPGKSYYEFLLEKMNMDYLLLGEHFFYNSRGEFKNMFVTVHESEDYLDYAKNCVKGMKTGYFKILAHPDLFGLFCEKWDRNCEEASDIIIQGALDSGMVLEVNANGRRRGLKEYEDGIRYPYPVEKFWMKVKEAKVPCIVGSDCHNFDNLWDDYVEESFVQLKEWGISPLEKIDL